MPHPTGYLPDPERPGGLIRAVRPYEWFLDIYGGMRVWPEGERTVRLRLVPEEIHLNLLDTVHGGFVMAVVDHALFMGPTVLGIDDAQGGVTIEASTQFMRPVRAGLAMDVVIEVLRETRRLVFVRGLIEQDDQIAASFGGTIKKGSQAK